LLQCCSETKNGSNEKSGAATGSVAQTHPRFFADQVDKTSALDPDLWTANFQELAYREFIEAKDWIRIRTLFRLVLKMTQGGTKFSSTGNGGSTEICNPMIVAIDELDLTAMKRILEIDPVTLEMGNIRGMSFGISPLVFAIDHSFANTDLVRFFFDNGVKLDSKWPLFGDRNGLHIDDLLTHARSKVVSDYLKQRGADLVWTVHTKIPLKIAATVNVFTDHSVNSAVLMSVGSTSPVTFDLATYEKFDNLQWYHVFAGDVEGWIPFQESVSFDSGE